MRSNSRPLRLCHVITTPNDQYSTGLQTRNGAEIARDMGFEVDIVTGVALDDKRLIQPLPGVTYHRLPVLTKYIYPSQDLAAVWRLYQLFRSRQYDVVFTHLAKAGVLGRLAAGLAGVPVVAHDVQGPVFHSQLSRPRRWLYTFLERLAGRYTHYYFFVAAHLRDSFIAEKVGPRAEKRVAYTGLNLSRFLDAAASGAERTRLRATWGLAPHHQVMGYMARLVPGKGQYFAIDALGRLAQHWPDLRLLLVGGAMWKEEQQYLQRLRDLTAKLGLEDRVIFAGHQTEVLPFYQMCDLCVFPSMYEGTANAMLEALVFGLPVVAFDIPATFEFGGGEIVTANYADPAALAQALERALAAGPGVAPSRALRERLVRQFSLAQWRETIKDFYIELSQRPLLG